LIFVALDAFECILIVYYIEKRLNINTYSQARQLGKKLGAKE